MSSRDLLRRKTGNKEIDNFHDGCVNSVIFSPDGKWLVSTADDKCLKIFNLNRELFFDVEDVHGKIAKILLNEVYTFTIKRELLIARITKCE